MLVLQSKVKYYYREHYCSSEVVNREMDARDVRMRKFVLVIHRP